MSDPGHLLLCLAVTLASARAAGALAQRAGQPRVLGELLAGLLLGALGVGPALGLDLAGTTPLLHGLGELGVVVLLFEVGLESKAGELLRQGPRALAVACVGVAVPVLLGMAVGCWLLPQAPTLAQVFLGASLAATSVGITARVFRDLGVLDRPEAHLVLGAAVIDDVLGLVLLGVVSGLVAHGGAFQLGLVVATLAKAGGFVLGALFLGVAVVPRAFRLAARAGRSGLTIALALALALALSALAAWVGLAPLLGAFAAGLMLEGLSLQPGGGPPIELSDWVLPLSTFLVPVFFVQVGARVEFSSLREPSTLLLAAALTIAAVLGKQACGLVAGPALDRLTVGLAMIPRGEVGLIFANLGQSLQLEGGPIFSPGTYAAVVAMCLATTLMTPPALRASVRRAARP